MDTIVIIPARGSSKRLPQKNIRSLAGLPLIVHSIKYAQNNLNFVDKIYVSTDDRSIRTIAEDCGVESIERPESLATDTATTVSVLKHVLETINSKSVKNVILLQPTNPLRPKKLLFDAFETYVEGKYDSLMTVSQSFRKLGKINDGRFIPYNYKIGQRSQDLEPLYYENGLLYITKAQLIIDNLILGKDNCPYKVNHPYSTVDIDDENDLSYAEFILNQYPNA